MTLSHLAAAFLLGLGCWLALYALCVVWRCDWLFWWLRCCRWGLP